MTNKQELREAAEKATPGNWCLQYGEDSFDADDALILREASGYLPICKIEGAHPESGFDEDFQQEQQANAEFIAAANPATVLALLDELEAAEKRIAELEGIATSPRPYQVEPGRWGCPTCHYQGHESAVYAALCVFCSNKYKGED